MNEEARKKLEAFSLSFGKGRDDQRALNKENSELKEIAKKRKKALFGSDDTQEKEADKKPVS